jgi:hypothetical protein
MKYITKCWKIVIVTLVVAAFLAVGPLTAAQAYVINFDNLQPFNDYDPIPSGYGSNANVTVSYQTLYPDFNPALNYAEIWNGGYANLNTAVYAGYQGGILDITLTANNPSQSVTLNSFNVAAYSTGNYTRKADIFKVIDGDGNVLINYGLIDISGLIANTLYPNVSANSVSILLGYDWNNGINNINFSTSASTVPVPAAVWLFGSGLFGLLGLKRKFSK